MYLHLGQDTVITTDTIIGIFDIDRCTVSKKTRDYLAQAEKNKSVINVSFELPKSFIVCEENGGIKVYISQLSAKTLRLRMNEASYSRKNKIYLNYKEDFI